MYLSRLPPHLVGCGATYVDFSGQCTSRCVDDIKRPYGYSNWPLVIRETSYVEGYGRYDLRQGFIAPFTVHLSRFSEATREQRWRTFSASCSDSQLHYKEVA